MCGEKKSVSAVVPSIWGSPPRVRGEVHHSKTSTRKDRITPACAGRSFLSLVFQLLMKDHPRVCGEKLVRRHLIVECVGSPPRVRGEVNQVPEGTRRHRITPACAGRRKASNSPCSRA